MNKSATGVGQFCHSMIVSGSAIIDKPRSLNCATTLQNGTDQFRNLKKKKREFYRLLFYASINSKFSCFHENKLCVAMFTTGLWEWEESPYREAYNDLWTSVELFGDFIKVSSFNLKL